MCCGEPVKHVHIKLHRDCSPSICFVISRSFYNGTPIPDPPTIAPDTRDSNRAKRSKASCVFTASIHHGVAEQRSLEHQARRHVGKARLTSRPSGSSGRTPRAYVDYQGTLSLVTSMLAPLPCRMTFSSGRGSAECSSHTTGTLLSTLLELCIDSTACSSLNPGRALHSLKGSVSPWVQLGSCRVNCRQGRGCLTSCKCSKGQRHAALKRMLPE